jgi:hypothetical protein
MRAQPQRHEDAILASQVPRLHSQSRQSTGRCAGENAAGRQPFGVQCARCWFLFRFGRSAVFNADAIGQVMTSHNARVVALQQEYKLTNSATASALAVVRELGEKAREKDDIIAGLRMELEEIVVRDDGCDGEQAAVLQTHDVAAERDQVLAGNEEAFVAKDQDFGFVEADLADEIGFVGSEEEDY